MKKIVINSDNRRFNISSIVVGYLEENKEEVLEFEIPEKYSEYGKKACFSAKGQTFAKTFDDVISNKLTITRDISQFKELDMTIEFFKIENEDEIVARTSILHILIENAIICDDDVKPDEPKIIILDNLIDEVTKVGLEVGEKGDYAKEQGDYAKSQGDYAKEQKIEVIKANEEANRIINNFETNVGEYTTAFNENANNKTIDFDSNAENKTSDFNQNADNKISEYNNNASEKLSAYNTNAENKKSEFDTNVANKTKTFNDNASDKLIEYNQNDTTKTNTFNDNATNKTTEYNNNAISKVNEFNTNANNKLQEYNTNADNKIAEYDLHSQELDNKIIDTRNELERVKNDVLETGTDTDTYIHLEDSAMAEYQELSVDGVCEQETTSIANGDEYDSPSPDYPQPISTIENSISIKSTGKNLFDVDSITENSFLLAGTGEIGSTSSSNVSDYIFVKINQSYCLSFSYTSLQSTNYRSFCYYDTNKNFISSIVINPTSFYTFTPAQDGYIRFGYDKNYTNIQLERGLSATPYEQHLEIQITANLPEGEFIGKINDTYKDTLKVEYNEEDGQYHLNLYKRVYKNNSYNGESYNYYISTTARKDGNIECGELQTGQVVYYVGDETIIDLGVVDQLLSYDKVSNVFTNSDLLPQINLKYYRNFESTVRNLQINNGTLQNELSDLQRRVSALETAQTSVASESEVVE